MTPDHLQMGFFCPPDSEARCDKIRITTNSGKAYEYSFERIERGGTTYLNIGETPSREYNLEYINAAADLVKFWPSKVPGISSSGSFLMKGRGRYYRLGQKRTLGIPTIYYNPNHWDILLQASKSPRC